VIAVSGRKLGLAVLSNQNVRVDGRYDVFGETPKTARETRALPISNGWVLMRMVLRRCIEEHRYSLCIQAISGLNRRSPQPKGVSNRK
jgi:hypothetical protein